jgi:hypothetical protein
MEERLTKTGIWLGSQKEGNHYEDIGIGRCIILKWILEKYDRVVWTGLIWLRVGNSTGLLRTRCESSVT